MVEHWVERGKKLVYPQKYISWSKYINRIYNDKNFSTNYAIFYAAMEELEKGSPVEEVCDFINSLDAITFSRDVVFKTILLYSKRGPEFYRKAKAPLVNTAEKFVRVIEKENIGFQQSCVK